MFKYGLLEPVAELSGDILRSIGLMSGKLPGLLPQLLVNGFQNTRLVLLGLLLGGVVGYVVGQLVNIIWVLSLIIPRSHHRTRISSLLMVS